MANLSHNMTTPCHHYKTKLLLPYKVQVLDRALAGPWAILASPFEASAGVLRNYGAALRLHKSTRAIG